MSKQYKLIRCNINGKDVEKMVDVRASLTDMLRNDYHLTSVKKGCEVGAIQCGFCTPGFLMTAVEILDSGKLYSDEELRKLLSGHLCRCTGYENILKAVKKTMYRRLGMEVPAI